MKEFFDKIKFELKAHFNELFEDKYVKTYFIEKEEGGCFKICRVINKYKTEEEAQDKMLNLLVNGSTEKELLKQYSKNYYNS